MFHVMVSELKMKLVGLVALALLARTGAGSVAAAEIEVRALEKAIAGEHVVFTLDIARPADMGALAIEGSVWQPSAAAWPRMPELSSRPASAALCYLEYQRFNMWEPVPARALLTFVGRAKMTDALDLTLRYPLASGGWREGPVKLALRDAAAIAAPSTAPTAAHDTATQRWARAQVRHFGLLARHVGDFGGFWAFAAERTGKRFEVTIAPDATDFPRRGGDGEERLYAVATGALAIQESLQLDRMTEEPDRDDAPASIEMGKIVGVEVKSHPFDEMRGGKEPVDSALAALVPEDFYFARFARVAKLLELLELADRWGGSLLRLADTPGLDYGVRERVLRQLGLTDEAIKRLDPLVTELAVIGSDPYLVDGADVTLLLRPRGEAEGVEIGGILKEAHSKASASAGPKARSAALKIDDVAIDSVSDGTGRVACFQAVVDGVHVLSNSKQGMQRILDVRAGRRTSLAKAVDYKYMRAVVFPLDETREDGFLYLSDSFIRAVVGPEIRIKQQRRLQAAASLKRIANAALLHGYENGPGQPTLQALKAAKYLTNDDLRDPQGGEFTFDAATGRARSSVWGELGNLTPLLEIDAPLATPAESLAYGQFRDRYEQYWRTYFDPIGVRIGVQPTLRFEVCILPLINSSTYDEFAELASGPPMDVPIHTFTPTTLFRFVSKFSDSQAKRQVAGFMTMLGVNAGSDWLGDWVTFWVEDTDAFLKLVRREYADPAEGASRDFNQEIIDVFDASFVLGVQVKNKVSLAAFLIAMRSFIQQSAPETVVFNALPPYRDVTIVQIAPDSRTPWAPRADASTQPAGAAPPTSQSAVREVSPALYYATIGDAFYLSTQASALRSIADRTVEFASAAPPAPRIMPANVLVYAAPGAAERIRPTVSFLLEQRARATAVRNMAQVWLLGRCGVLEGRALDEVTATYLGCRLACPHDGSYAYDAARDEARSPIYDGLHDVKRLEALPPESPLSALLDSLRTMTGALQFTKEGLLTTVEIERR